MKQDNEVFLGNILVSKSSEKLRQLENAGITTARIGKQAYDIHGKKLPSDYAPLFIAKAQNPLYDRMMEKILRRIRMG